MAGFKVWFGAGAALLLLAACERPSAVASKPHDSGSSAVSDSDVGEQASATAGSPRGEEAVPTVDGKPMWSSSRKGSAQENAAKAAAESGGHPGGGEGGHPGGGHGGPVASGSEVLGFEVVERIDASSK